MGEITPYQLLCLEWSFVAFTLVLVVIRFYARFRLRRSILTLNDFFAILAWMCFCSQIAMDQVLYNEHVFDEVDDDQADNISGQVTSVLALKVIYVSDASYYWSLYAVKLSMLCFYMDLVPTTMKKTRLVMWLTVGITVVGFFVTELVLLLYCQPVWLNWSQDEEIACQVAWTVPGNAVPWFFHLLSDLLIYSIPIPVIRVVKLPRKQKIGVGITFGLGFACIAFAVGTILSSWYSESATLEWIFAAFEQTYALMICCAPAFKFFLTKDVGRKVLERVTGSWSRSASRSRNGSRNRSTRERSRSRMSVIGTDQSVTNGFSRLGSRNGEEDNSKDKASATENAVEMFTLPSGYHPDDVESGVGRVRDKEIVYVLSS